MSILSSPFWNGIHRISATTKRSSLYNIIGVFMSSSSPFSTSTVNKSNHQNKHHNDHNHDYENNQSVLKCNNNNDSKIGFIGIGKIAQSIIQAIVKKKLIRPENIHASEINKEYMAYLRERCDVFQVSFKILYYLFL